MAEPPPKTEAQVSALGQLVFEVFELACQVPEPEDEDDEPFLAGPDGAP